LAKKAVKKKAKAAKKKRATVSAKKKAKAPLRKKSAKTVAKKKTRPANKGAAAKKKSAKTAKAASKKVAPKKKKRAVAQSRKVASKNGKGRAATVLDPVQFPEQPVKKVKTYLTAKQLRYFKAMLEQKRAQLFGDVERLTSEALGQNSQGGEHASMPIHMADAGSDNWEQDFTLGLIANERALVRDIDEALDRISNKTYGICVATQTPISVARLEAKPWAKYGIEYARMRDEGRLR
jgi:RNA polymerase-binding transcription factor